MLCDRTMHEDMQDEPREEYYYYLSQTKFSKFTSFPIPFAYTRNNTMFSEHGIRRFGVQFLMGEANCFLVPRKEIIIFAHDRDKSSDIFVFCRRNLNP